MSRGSSVSIVSGYKLDDWAIEVRSPAEAKGCFPLASVSRLALGPTQPPVQWVPGVLSPGLKCSQGVTLTTHPHLVPRLRVSRSYSSSLPSAFMVCSGTALAFSIYVVMNLSLFRLNVSHGESPAGKVKAMRSYLLASVKLILMKCRSLRRKENPVMMKKIRTDYSRRHRRNTSFTKHWRYLVNNC
jgi:hypothetical protein